MGKPQIPCWDPGVFNNIHKSYLQHNRSSNEYIWPDELLTRSLDLRSAWAPRAKHKHSTAILQSTSVHYHHHTQNSRSAPSPLQTTFSNAGSQYYILHYINWLWAALLQRAAHASNELLTLPKVAYVTFDRLVRPKYIILCSSLSFYFTSPCTP